MIRIEVQCKNLDEARARLNPELFRESRSRACSESLDFLLRKARGWIRSAGGGRWPGFHPLSRSFSKKGGTWVRRSRRLNSSNWNFLMGFLSAWQSPSADAAKLSYGGRGGKVSRMALNVEQGRRIGVTQPMRRLMGATRGPGKLKQTPGLSFFPLRKSTASLVLPPRPIMEPIYRTYRSLAERVFEEEFADAVKEKLE